MGYSKTREISLHSALVLAASAVSIHLALGLWLRNDPLLLGMLSDLYLPIPNTLAVIGLLYAAKRSEIYGKRVQLAWSLMALAEVSSVLANVIWAVIELYTHQTPFPSAADGFYLMIYPVFILGILLLPATSFTRTGRIKIILETGVIVISAVLAFWTFLIEPTIQASPADAIELVLTISYPVLDLLMLFSVIDLLFRRMGSSNSGSLYVLAAGMIVAIASDAVYLLQILNGTYQSGGLSDTGLVAWYCLVWLAGVLQGSESKPGQMKALGDVPASRHQAWISYLPYFWVCAAYLLLIWSYSHPNQSSFYAMYLSVGGIIGLMLLRQIVTYKENSRLYAEARQEIAERKRIEDALRESEERYRSVVEQASEIIFLADTSTWHILDANLAFKNQMGYAQEEIGSLTLFDIVSEDKESIDRNILAASTQGHCFLPSRKYRKKDGSIIDVEVNINFLEHKGKKMHCVVARDITERLRSQEAIQKSEARYRSLFDGVPVGLFRMLPSGRLVDVNQPMVEMLGYPDKESLLEQDASCLYADCQGRRPWQGLMERDGMVRSFQEKMRCFDGSDLWVEVSSRAVKDKQGQVTCYEGSLQDITERKLADEARLQSESRFRTIFETALSYIIIKDREGRYVQINPAMEKLLGMLSSDLAGKTDTDLFGPEIGERIAHADSRVVQGEVIEDEITLPIRGEQVVFHYVKAPMHDSSGRISGLYGIAQDMTAHKKDKEHLTASLLEKEVLLREVHHRVKNNLQIISSLLSIQTKYLQDDRACEMLKECQGRVRSMALIHENLYRSESLAKVNFAQYIRSLTRYICQSFGDSSRINIILQLDDTFMNIDYAIPCGLIVNELITNSFKHAFPDGRTGRIWIELKSLSSGQVYLSVKDDGVGLPQSTMRGSYKSMGLQLVKALSSQIKATLEIDGSNGTSFKISFFVNAGDAEEKSQSWGMQSTSLPTARTTYTGDK